MPTQGRDPRGTKVRGELKATEGQLETGRVPRARQGAWWIQAGLGNPTSSPTLCPLTLQVFLHQQVRVALAGQLGQFVQRVLIMQY